MESTKEIIKSSFAKYLALAPKKVNGNDTYICPLCGNGTGASGDGITVYKGTQLKCFKCGFSGDLIDLYGQEHNTEYAESIQALCSILGIVNDYDNSSYVKPVKKETAPAPEVKPEVDNRAYFTECYKSMSSTAVNYLQSRGLSEKLVKRFYIGYDTKEQRVIIPVNKSFYIARDITGTNQQRYKNPKGVSISIFNINTLYDANSSNAVFITEGAFDALSIIEAGGNAIALNSVSNDKKLIELLQDRPTDKVLLLALDNDEAGRTCSKRIAEALTALNIQCYESNIIDAYHDVNEALVKDRSKFIATVKSAAVKVLRKDSVLSYIENSFLQDIEHFKAGGDRKTGFKYFDEQSKGIYNGLYVIGGVSSVGKTTFAHQLADQLAAQGEHILYFSMEQSKLEMICKSINRAAMKEGEYTSNLQLRKGYTNDKIKQGIAKYVSSVGDRVNIIEGNFLTTVSEIRKYALQYISNNNVKPVIFVDYLQILQADVDPVTNRRPTDPKLIADYNITALKRLSRELDIPVIVISSLNRGNYLAPVDFESFKESGAIEYTADVVIGLQLQVMHDDIFCKEGKVSEKRDRVLQAKKETPRKIELVCLKNRYGAPSFNVKFAYYAQHDYYAEETVQGDNNEVTTPRVRY